MTIWENNSREKKDKRSILSGFATKGGRKKLAYQKLKQRQGHKEEKWKHLYIALNYKNNQMDGQ